MPKLFYLFTSLWIMGFCVSAQSQVIIKGKIVNQNGQGVGSSNVTAYQITTTDTNLVTFALANGKGEYSLKLNSELAKYQLVARGLGYEATIFNITVTKPDTIVHDFVMNPKMLQINEVVVRAVVPVRIEKDTTTYNVKAFADGSEKTVEDLLKKLPGIKVADDGKITLKGKPIDKVMIEGEEFFSKNYRLITKNLTADVLDKVQAIENYAENNLLQGIEKSGKSVLNLSIKADRKLSVFGNVSVAAGTENRYEATTALFSLVKKIKFGIIGNANNTGYDPIQNAEYELAADEDAFAGFNAAGDAFRPLSFLEMAHIPDVDSRRVTFNQAKLIGTNLNYKADTSLKIRGFGYYYGDGLSAGNVVKQQFLLDKATIQIQDSSWNHRTPRLWAGQLRADYLLNAKTSIRWISDIKNTKVKNDYWLDSQNLELSERITANGQENVTMANHQLNLVHRLKGKNAILADVGYTSNELPQQKQVMSNRFPGFFRLNSSYNQLLQNTQNNNQEYKAIVRWKGATAANHFTIGAGFLQRTEQLNSDIVVQNNDSQRFKPDTAFMNGSRLQKNIFLAEGQYQIKWKALRLVTSGSLQVTNSDFEDKIHQIDFSESRLLFNPSVGVGADLGRNQRVFGSFSRNQTLPTINDLASGYVLGQYRSFDRSKPIFNVQKTDMWLLSYSNMNWTNYYSINGSLSYSRLNSSNISNYQLSNTLSFTTNRPIYSPIDSVSADYQIDKLFTKISMKVRLEGNLSQTQTINSINSTDLQQSTVRNIHSRIYFISAFSGIFNFTVSTSWNVSSVYLENSNTAQNQTRLLKPSAWIRLKPHPDWFIKITAERIDWKQNERISQTNFIDFEVRYNPKVSKWSYQIDGYNLLNAKQIQYTQLSNYLVYESAYNLQPRFITFSVSRSL
jgi:hypothetical protein